MLTDDEILDAYRTAVDVAMNEASARDGFASNMSRESRVAGLRAIEREAAARALEEAGDFFGEGGYPKAWLRTRAAKIRTGPHQVLNRYTEDAS